MARPKRPIEETWFDEFTKWDEADREAALKVLTHLHRALSRDARRSGKLVSMEPPILAEEQEPASC
jgi:hypothetical protein